MNSDRSDGGLGRAVIVIIAVLLGLPILFGLIAMPMGLFGFWWDHGMMGSVSPIFLLPMAGIWLLILGGLAVALIAILGRDRSSSAGEDRALEELRVAYARGELSDDEFEQRRARLKGRD